jgi:hypothetical protein
MQSFINPQTMAAAAAMGQNFVLFPFLDQLHHGNSAFHNMQPFLTKSGVSN